MMYPENDPIQPRYGNQQNLNKYVHFSDVHTLLDSNFTFTPFIYKKNAPIFNIYFSFYPHIGKTFWLIMCLSPKIIQIVFNVVHFYDSCFLEERLYELC